MKDILEQHAESLSLADRAEIWRRVDPMRRTVPSWPRWFVPAVAGAAAIVVAMNVPTMSIRVVSVPPETSTPRLAEPQVGIAEPSRPSLPDVGVVPAAPMRSPARLAPAPPRLVLAPPVQAPAVLEATPAPAATAAAPGSIAGRVTDASGQPVPFANVIVQGTRTGTMTDERGEYRIVGLPPAAYRVTVQSVGRGAMTHPDVQVESDRVASADFRMSGASAVQKVEEITVTGEKRIDTRSSTTRRSLAAEDLAQAQGRAAAPSPAIVRGGRPSESMNFDGVDITEPARVAEPKSTAAVAPPAGAPVAAAPPVIPNTGGTHLPNDEPFDAMYFKHHGVNPFVTTGEDALSTFAVDVDAASYTVMRRYLGLGHLPPADAVRVEEFVNFFAQDYPQFENDDFRILVDGSPSPFGDGYHLLRVGLKGREVADRDRKAAQLTFVVDVSGSMAREDRLGLVRRALRLLVHQLRDGDQVGLVVYGSRGRVVLEPVEVDGPALRLVNVSPATEGEPDLAGIRDTGRRRILDAIDQLMPDGSTNAEEGLRLGYDMARRGYRRGASNRIVLCSDGVANVGRTGPQSILETVRTEADRGIHLTTIGFGMGNYNDVLMEQLADRGDGNHYYVDDLDEAHRVFVENLTGTLQTIAKDAKVQVQFDPARVERYRLIGFENRDVADRDFRNDAVDAGEIGAGHEVTALYEIKLSPKAGPGPIGTVRLRYARPEQEGARAGQVHEIARRFDASSLARRFEHASPRFRLDAAVAEFAEILRGSYWARDGKLEDVLAVARDAAGSLRDPASLEFAALVERAITLRRNGSEGTPDVRR